ALATVCFVMNDVTMLRSSLVRQMSILADVLGSNSTAALNFQDADAADELLKSLARQPAVEYACIYTLAGQPFATYQRESADPIKPPGPKEIGSQFVAGGFLDVVEAIEQAGQPIGRIYLRANADELRNQITRYAMIVVAMLSISMGTSVLLSSRFQRVISLPILKLADAAKHVSVERDFGIRVR